MIAFSPHPLNHYLLIIYLFYSVESIMCMKARRDKNSFLGIISIGKAIGTNRNLTSLSL